ncbi:MAG: ATP-binding protein [Candidatus Lokiarchaeota archaeon]|nr:ATP-binding protein [Candidatus Lokiarchaeota archaeon]
MECQIFLFLYKLKRSCYKLVGNGKVITVSGKGGVGKSTFAALLLKIMVEHDGDRDILAVDADPASSLPDLLGREIDRTQTVGGAAFNLKKRIEKGSSPGGIPPNITKKSVLEADIFNVLQEFDDYDLIVMGRTEGEGCYCYPNQLMTEILDNLSENYDITLMDMEAGLEHLSRRTARDVDIMFVITDPSKMGLHTVKRIKDILKEVHTTFRKMYLIGNRFSDDMKKILDEEAAKLNVEVIGIIPNDPKVAELNFGGKPIVNISKDSAAYIAVKEIAKKAGLIKN